ncbi:MAG: cytochrome c3 family protein [Nitrospirota bacterium]
MPHLGGFARGHRASVTLAVLVFGVALTATGCRSAPQSGKTPLEAALESVTAPAEGETPVLPPGVTLGEAPVEGLSPEATGVPSQDPVEAAEAPGSEPHPLAFAFLPQTEQGYVDWVSAVELGVIRPIDSLDPMRRALEPMKFDVVFPVKGDLPDVVYPHYGHTLWLDCKNCHPGIFVMRAGANRVTMDAILKGEFCGRCHGKVAFSLADCNRCHSRPKPGRPFIIPRASG